MGIWLTLLGGVALFSYGLNLTSDGLKTITNGPLKNWLLLATRRAWTAGSLGMAATLLAGSSSAITVMVVGFVNAGLLSLQQALQVILGAALGTTLTVQLVSFNLIRFAPLLIFLGVLLAIVNRQRQRGGGYGPLLLGFGFIFYGMLVMTGTARHIAELPGAPRLFQALSTLPLVPFFAGIVVTALIQNSATTIALTISFALHGALSPITGLEVVLGANVGTTAAAIYTALMGSRAAKRTALAYFVMKLAGALAALIFVDPVAHLLAALDPNPGRILANGHTLFNLVNGLVFLPLTGWLAAAVEHWLPDVRPEPVSRLLAPDLLDAPDLALRQTWQEVTRLASLIDMRMMQTLPALIRNPGDGNLRLLNEAESNVDLLHHAIHAYLARLPRARLTEAQLTTQIRLMSLANHLEHLSDTLVKTGATAKKLADREFVWTSAFWDDLAQYLGHLLHQYSQATGAIARDDAHQARTLVQEHPELLREEGAVRYRALSQADQLNTNALAALLELLDDLTVLSQRVASLGRVILGML